MARNADLINVAICGKDLPAHYAKPGDLDLTSASGDLAHFAQDRRGLEIGNIICHGEGTTCIENDGQNISVVDLAEAGATRNEGRNVGRVNTSIVVGMEGQGRAVWDGTAAEVERGKGDSGLGGAGDGSGVW